MEDCSFSVNSQVSACNCTKSDSPPRVFFTFFCTNDAKFQFQQTEQKVEKK